MPYRDHLMRWICVGRHGSRPTIRLRANTRPIGAAFTNEAITGEETDPARRAPKEAVQQWNMQTGPAVANSSL